MDLKYLIKLKEEYLHLCKDDTFDFDKFNQFAIVHHSNSIEGSTLTKEETFILLNDALTPKNKPLEHTFMAIDHFNALKYSIELANSKKLLSVETLKDISAKVMKNTGSSISAIAGDFDSSKGDFRKVTVRAGTSTFMDYTKIPKRILELVNYINKEIKIVTDFESIYNLAFDAHFQLVSIHPFADGNGRISRLLMNYIQAYHKQPLTVVFKEDKTDYYQALVDTREKEDISIFRKFMYSQTEKFFLEKISELTKTQKQSSNQKGLSFLF
ncbi:Fic family protein [Polaribacter cellanae]|uniref:Fic family protein n=1 Tax=Polaribacter cellanae TaxID=2818493 RepID=A0A975CM64_9FLAO|nr:Fic family protein [Polaribacter cellanae]QTE21637.1 Fic family protein [Polaribacter cellanae]